MYFLTPSGTVYVDVVFGIVSTMSSVCVCVIELSQPTARLHQLSVVLKQMCSAITQVLIVCVCVSV